MKNLPIFQKHPIPWRYVNQGGNIFMMDGLGQQVLLFELLDVVVLITAMLAAPVPAEPAPA